MIIKNTENEKNNQKIVVKSIVIESDDDDIKNIMNDMIYSIEVNSLKKKRKSNNQSGGY